MVCNKGERREEKERTECLKHMLYSLANQEPQTKYIKGGRSYLDKGYCGPKPRGNKRLNGEQ